MSETLSCGGLQELASEAQEIFASLQRGALHDVMLPEDFKSPVGLLQFAVAVRKTAASMGHPIRIHAADPALHAVAVERGLGEVLEPLTSDPKGGADV